MDRIWQILYRTKITAYIHERDPSYGEYIPETLKQTIKNSTSFVTFLTQNGVLSQWVNQEIGIAHAFGILVIPINQIGVKSTGFIELRKYIPYEASQPEEMIYPLIARLRGLLNKHAEIPNGLILVCTCGHSFETTLPSLEDIVVAIEKKFVYKDKCPKCGHEIQYSPMTLECIPEEPFLI